MTLIPGFNLAGNADVGKLASWTQAAHPAVNLVLDNDGITRTLAQYGLTVARRWLPDGIWYSKTPAEFLSAHSDLVGHNILVNVENEAGLPTKWYLDLIRLNKLRSQPLKLVIGNLSVGTPSDTSEWDKPDVVELLAAIAANGHYLGLHEYCHGVIVSGLQGADMVNNAGYWLNPKNWPAVMDANKNNWHVGRVKFMVDACHRNRIPVPNVIMTEFGFDALGDMENGWFKGSHGWKELEGQWRAWYPGLSSAEVAYMMFWYASEVIYSAYPCVKGMAAFCFGAVDKAKWGRYDFQDLPMLLDLLKAWKTPPTLSHLVNATPPQPTPAVDYTPYRVEFVGTGYTSVNIRAGAATSAAKLATAATRGLAVFSDGKAVNGWLRLRLPATGEFGFVSAAYVRLEKLPLTMKG